MKLKDILKPFCTKGVFDSVVCITVDSDEIILNPGDELKDVSDLGDRTVLHCYVSESVLFVEVKDLKAT